MKELISEHELVFSKCFTDGHRTEAMDILRLNYLLTFCFPSFSTFSFAYTFPYCFVVFLFFFFSFPFLINAKSSEDEKASWNEYVSIRIE